MGRNAQLAERVWSRYNIGGIVTGFCISALQGCLGLHFFMTTYVFNQFLMFGLTNSASNPVHFMDELYSISHNHFLMHIQTPPKDYSMMSCLHVLIQTSRIINLLSWKKSCSITLKGIMELIGTVDPFTLKGLDPHIQVNSCKSLQLTAT